MLDNDLWLGNSDVPSCLFFPFSLPPSSRLLRRHILIRTLIAAAAAGEGGEEKVGGGGDKRNWSITLRWLCVGKNARDFPFICLLYSMLYTADSKTDLSSEHLCNRRLDDNGLKKFLSQVE